MEPTITLSRARTLRVLWVSEVSPDPNSGAGGTELLMVAGLRRLGHQVDTAWAEDLPRRIRHGNLHYAVELSRTYLHAIQDRCRHADYDVVTVNLGQSYLAAEKLRKEGFPGVFVVRSHGLDDHLERVLAPWRHRLGVPHGPVWKRLPGRLLQRVLARHLKRAARACDGYVVSSSLDANFLRERHRLAAEQVACIPQAPAAAFVRHPASPITAERTKRILYVANYHYAKGPHAVAEAAKRLQSRDSDCSLTWICHPKDHDDVKRLLGNETRARVRLLGWMSQDELVKEFDQHGIFLYPSLFDGFGKIFLEAMSRGLCVIGTRAGGMVDIIRHGENGFLCAFDDPGQIVDHVGKLRENWHLASRMSASAAAMARQYTWERVGHELSEFFEGRLAANRAAHGKNARRWG